MSGNEHEFRIRIRGILDSSVAGAMERMQAMMTRMQTAQRNYNNANRQANELRPYLKTLVAMQRQFDSMNKAKQKAGELSQSIRQSQQLLTQLTNQRVQAMQRVSEAERQRNTTRDRLNQTKAEQELIRSRQASIRENLRNLRAESGNESNRESIRRLTQELTELQRKSRELSETRKSQSSEATRANNQYRNSVKELEQIQRRIDTTENRTTNMQSRYQSQIEAIRRLRAELSSAGVDVQHLADAEARLRQQIEQTNSQLNQRQTRENRLNQAQNRFDQASFNANNAYSNFQNTVGIVSEIMDPVQESLNVGMEFEASVSRVQAILSAGKSQRVDMTELEELAMHLGATTSFKASQVVDAEYYAALAGWKEDAIKAALPSVLNLAQAAGVGIDRAMDVISDEMTAFGLDTKNGEVIAKYVDKFVYTFSNANTDLEQLHEALKYAAPAMKVRGATYEEAMTQIGLQANVGIKGSMAGTSSRKFALYTIATDAISADIANVLAQQEEVDINSSDFKKQQAEAQQALQGLFTPEQIETFKDTERGYSNFLDALGQATVGKSGSEIAQLIQPFTGLTAFSGIAPLIEAAANGNYDEFLTGLKNEQDTAKQVAAVMKDNVQGSKEIYESAVEAVQLRFSKVFQPITREYYDQMGTMAGNLAEWISKNQELVRTIGLIAGGLAGVTVAGTGLFAAFTGIQYISSGIGLIATKITMLPNIFSVAASGIRGAFLSLAGLSLPVLAGLTLLAGAAYLIYDNWETIGPIFESTFADIQTVISGAMETLGPAIESMSTGFEQIKSQLGETDFSTITNAMEKIALFLAGLVASLGVIGATIIAIFVELGAAIIDTLGVAFQTISMMIDGDFTGAFNFAVEHIKSIISGLASSMLSTLSTAFKAVSGIVSSIGSAMDNVGVKEVRGGGLAQVAHNAAGGIYLKGAFLTTFAEDSAEAAIPLDGSRRAISLWQQAGQILGVYPSNSASDLSQNANSVLQNARQILGVYPSNSASDLSQNANSVLQNASQILGVYPSNSASDLSQNANSVLQNASQILGVYSSNSASDLSQNALSNANLLTQSKNVSLLGRIEQILGVYSSVNSIPETGAVNTVSDLINTESNSNFMAPNVNIEFTINGNADREIMQESANRIVESIQQTFEEQYLAMLHERSRVAFS